MHLRLFVDTASTVRLPDMFPANTPLENDKGISVGLADTELVTGDDLPTTNLYAMLQN